VICAYIDQYKHQFGVEPICRVLTEHDMQIAPSSYYAHRRRPVTDALRAEAVLVNVVIDLHRKNRDAYGIRKMWHAMTQAGHRVGRDQVARLMAIAGVQGVSRGQHTTTTTRRGSGAEHSRVRCASCSVSLVVCCVGLGAPPWVWGSFRGELHPVKRFVFTR
jgi:hypothetical protein